MAIESIISAIDAEIAKLEQGRSLLANGGKRDPLAPRKATTKVSAKPTKRVMSPESRQRIGDALRKRWAAKKKVNAVTPAKATKKAAKRTMSPEARARIAEAQRKRWATQKKAAKKTAPKKAAKAVSATANTEVPKAEATS